MQIIEQPDGTVFVYFYVKQDSLPIPSADKLVALPALDPPRQVAGVRFDIDYNGITINTQAAREFAEGILKACDIADNLKK